MIELIDRIFELQEAKDFFFDNLPLALMILDDQGRFIVVNNTFLSKLGYSSKDVVGHRYVDFLHPDDVVKSRDVEEVNVKNGTFAKELGYFENRYRTKDGRYLTFRWTENSAIFHSNYYLCYAEIKDDA